MTSNEMSLERFFLILQTKVRLIVGILAAALLLAGTITYTTPKTYKATASLNFEFSAGPVDSLGRSVLSGETYISTQQGIIESQAVAKEVENSLTEYERDRLIAALDARRSAIDALRSAITSPIRGLFSDKNKPAPETGVRQGGETEALQVKSPYNWLTRAIGYDLSVEPVFNSRIVSIAYWSTDRQIAALMANKYAEAYIATNLQMMIDPARKSKVWFDEQLKSLRQRLEEAQSKLTAYQQKEGIVSSDERLDTETSRLQNLSGQLVTAQQTTRNAVTQQQKLKEVLDSGASLMTLQAVFDNPVVQRLKGEVRSIETKIVENSHNLGNNHPRMKQLNSELFGARKRLKSAIQTITDGITNAADLSRERENDLKLALDAQKKLVLDLKNQHDRIAVIQREVESAQTTYNAALNQLNTTSMQSMVDQTNVSIVDRATVPRKHSSPRIMVNLTIGLLGGLLLGIGVAVFMDVFVRKVHSTDDLMGELGVPLLGHLKKV